MMKARLWLITGAALLGCGMAAAQTFDVASIRPSRARVEFERNGKIDAAHGTLRMQDVTVISCIHWAYGTQTSLITGPPTLADTRYDITAKTDIPDATTAQMRLMLQALLHDRFKLEFHKEKKEVKAYTLVIAKGGVKMKPAATEGEATHQNGVAGMVAHSISMPELADYLSDPLASPLVDGTGLPGRYDFVIDFTPYVDVRGDDLRPDMASVLGAALKGDLGLELVKQKRLVDVVVVDRVEAASSN